MPTVIIKPGATVFVTGANGLIGSHIVDQLLHRGYNVRGAVRDAEKTKWLKAYFDSKYTDVSFEMVAVPDMTVDGCYNDHVHGQTLDTSRKVDMLTYCPTGVQGFIHIAAPVGGILDLQTALDLGHRAGLNAMKACAKQPSINRFVNTSSMFAATFPQPDLGYDFVIDESTYNGYALEIAKKDDTTHHSRGILIYAAMKSETEKAMWKWMEENKPDFAMNSIVSVVNALLPKVIPNNR